MTCRELQLCAPVHAVTEMQDRAELLCAAPATELLLKAHRVKHQCYKYMASRQVSPSFRADKLLKCMQQAGTWPLRPGSGGVARQARQQRGSQSGCRCVQQALHGLQACAHLPHKDATWSEHQDAGRQPAP